MKPADLIAAPRPAFYFIGVTTSASSIVRVFPRWVESLGLGPVDLRGVDCRIHDEPSEYRRVVSFIKSDPLSIGGLVTTHKIDLLAACRDLFEELDPYAGLLGEASCISKDNGRLRASAKDPITSGMALDAFLPRDHWSRTGAELCVLGAGGSSLALTTHMLRDRPPLERPSRITITNRSAGRLEQMRKIHGMLDSGIPVDYVLAPDCRVNDAVVSGLKPGSLVANATGLGKDAPGSPLSDAARFPEAGIAWDFNYRGDLLFLKQAEAQRKARGLAVQDGWIYFIHGWTRVMAECFHTDIPSSGPGFEKLCAIAAEARR